MKKRSLHQSYYFNPRSRVGNDDGIKKAFDAAGISIHVPAWGTTVRFHFSKIPFYISIHVPAWGTTHFPTWNFRHSGNFNPRSRVGNDVRACYHPILPVISIHVPAWGTTVKNGGIPLKKIFQSTFPRGERLQIFTNILCFFMQ